MRNETDLVIETNQLQKQYGNKVVVSDLTLQVSRGEIFGFLGPNGAGKSTSVKMLLGLVRPDSGRATILGHPPGHPPTMARVGFLPEHFRFPEWLQARELLDLYGRLYHMDKTTRQRRIPELLELVRLTEHANRPISGFSKGMLQRIGLAQALLNKPDLVFLDEPTSALDPFGRMLVRNIIRDLKQQGTTVFLNSHLLGEVEATCGRVSFIKQGEVLQTLVLDDSSHERIDVAILVDEATPTLLMALHDLTIGTPYDDIRTIPTSDNGQKHRIEMTLTCENDLPILAERVLTSGARLYELVPRRMSLEQIFLEVVGTEDSGQ